MSSRLQVTLDDESRNFIELLSNKKNESESMCAASLIKEAMELHEDKAWSDLADERFKNTKKLYTHDEVWGVDAD